MAGSISLSMQTIFGNVGQLLAGGKVFFIAAGTTSDPQNAFYDVDLTLPLPNPYPLDASGRMPAFYLADGQIKVRVVDANGVQQYSQDNILVVGPSSGGGGGGGVDPSTVFQTGDALWLPVQGTRTGWSRANGRTLGSASSGATERANADTEALYTWLWNNFTNTVCPVSTGRGANAAADFAANKTITLLDWRGYVPGGLDDMGNSAASRFTGVPVVSGAVTTAGSVVGESVHQVSRAELPNLNLTVTIPSGQGSHQHNYTQTYPFNQTLQPGGANIPIVGLTTAATVAATLPALSGTAATGGSGTAHNNVQKTVLGTFFIKL